jgi:D-alanyl-D-alanine carboxypeptidase
MKNISLYCFLVISIIVFGCQKSQVLQTMSIGPGAPWADTSNKHPKEAAFKALIEKYRKLGLPGISLLVNDVHGTWIGASGKADIENDIDFVPGTVSKVASITKLFMGTLVFKMMEDSINTGMGYNALYKKVNEWLPSGITDKLPNGNEITLGQCLNHETGLPDVIEEDKFYLAVLNDPNKKWKPEELLEFIYNKKPDFAPGDTAVYSNTNFVIVTMILEAQTGRKHAELLKQYILHPLGLTNTYYQPYDKLPNSVAQGYYDLYNNNTLVNVSNLVTGSGNGYGGIYSNLFDLLKFENALFIQKTLLKPSSLAIMQTYGKRDDTNYYGYGLQKSYIQPDGEYAIGHKGRDLGYSANLFYFPQKGVTHIFLVNYGTDADSGLKDVFKKFVDELVSLSLQ